MNKLMHSKYNPYYKPLKISIPESTPFVLTDTGGFGYLPCSNFWNYNNQYSVPPRLRVAAAVSQPVRKDELKFGIDSILGLNKASYSDDESSQPELLFATSSIHHPSSIPSPPTFNTSTYLPTYYVERSTESEMSRNTSSPETTDSENSCTNKRESPAADAETDSEKSKRVRTIFSVEQMARLEEEFSRSQYMVGQERRYLASILKLSESQVKIWFQNRRIKYRKQFLDNKRKQLEEDGNAPVRAP